MKRLATVLALAAVGLTAGTAGAEEKRFESMARKVILESAGVKHGEVVVVAGGKHTLPLMETLAIEAQKAGAIAQMLVDSDRVIRAFHTEVPEQHVGQRPTFMAEWLKHVDVWIGLPTLEDPKSVFAGVPPERLAKTVAAGRVVTDMLDASGVRTVFIGYPTREAAALNEVDFATFEKMHWEAVGIDSRQIAERGAALRTALEGAKLVKVTAPSGTSLTFSIGSRPVFVDDGTIGEANARATQFLARTASLPAGRVFVAPLETSANGKVVVPRHRCRNEALTGISFDLVNGQLQNFKADTNGACFAAVLAPYSGPKDMFGFFQVGLNPARRVMENPGDYRPGDAAGMVWIGVGDNKLNGGNNTSPGGFAFPIVGATVEVDGKVLVRNGQLAL